MVEHIEKIRRLLRNMDEEDTDAESSGDDKNSEDDGSSTESGSESESGGESGSESESGGESGSESESSEESGSGSESGGESGSGSESSEESGSGSESGGESGSGSESIEESGSASESGGESGSESESSEESGSGSESGGESGSGSESGGESGSGSESGGESGSGSESGGESGSGSESGGESGSGSESGGESGSGSESGGESRSGSESGSDSELEGNSTSSSSSPSSRPNTNPLTTIPSPPVSVVDRIAKIILLNFNSFYAPPFFVYLTFNSVFRYINLRPARIVTFRITIVYYGFFRNLQEEKEIVEDALATCIIHPKDADKINGTCNYQCTAPKRNTTNAIAQIVGSPDFMFDNQSSSLNEEELTFSGEAALSFGNIQNQTFVVNKTAVLNNGEYTINENKYFILKGTIDPNQYQGKIGKDSLYIKFVDINKEIINIPCVIQSIANNNEYEFRCTPSSNLIGTLHLSQMYDNDTDKNEVTAITLNMGERYNNITYQINGKSTNSSTTKFNQAKYRKNSSGLSGGAIAGIVIACIIVLIIGTIILMMLRRPKAPEDNSTSVVGLKTIDNYSE